VLSIPAAEDIRVPKSEISTEVDDSCPRIQYGHNGSRGSSMRERREDYINSLTQPLGFERLEGTVYFT
jgi:hypothetical protein